jgi:GNAT superfamily N-acetyltransferase
MPGIGDGTARFFCGPDHVHREGLVAVSVDERGQLIIVGHVCLEPVSPGRSEMAIAVSDRCQHRGLGRAMLTRAITWAQDHGVTELGASIRGSNGAMIGLIRSMGLPVTLDDGDGGVVDAVIDVGARLPHAA